MANNIYNTDIRRFCKSCDAKSIQFVTYDDNGKLALYCECCSGFSPLRKRQSAKSKELDALFEELSK